VSFIFRRGLLVYLVLVILLSSFVVSHPPLPMELYGAAKLFNVPVNPGMVIQAVDSQGDVCGSFSVVNYGFFGTMSCLGENTSPSVSGAYPGELIRFRVGGFPASVLFNNSVEGIGTLHWESGKFQGLILVAPPLICGDGFCDSYENCNTCPEDCGECPAPPPPSSSPGASDPSDSPTPDFPGFDPGAPAFGPDTPGFGPDIVEEDELIDDCVESWSCGDWGLCLPSGIQYRDCVDVNQCGTDDDKPETERFCDYDAEAILPPDLIDRPRIEEPGVVARCDLRLPFFSVESLFFLVLFAIIVLVPLFFLKAEKSSIKKKKLEETEELLAIFHAEHKVYTFLIIASVLSVIVYLYHYFFFLCKDVYYNNLWLLFVFVLISPIVINVFLAFLKYSEREKLLKISLLNNTHYKHLLLLSRLQKEEIARSEAEISNQIYALNSRNEFGDLLSSVKEIKKIYDDLLRLYDLYIDGKDSLKTEKDLLNQIKDLDKNADFIKAVESHPELSSLKDNISLLYSAFESKQELDVRIHAFEDALKHPEKEDVSADGSVPVLSDNESSEESKKESSKESGKELSDGSSEESGDEAKSDESKKQDGSSS